MHIDVANIKNSKGAELKFDLYEDFNLLNAHLGELEFKEPVSLKGTISNINGKLLLKGNIKTTLQMYCSCCTKPIIKDIDLPIEEIFATDNSEEEIWVFSGDIIELNAVIISNIALNIPMKILCKEDCKGLCPICGHDLNESECGCDTTQRDPRFDKLNLLVFDNDEEV